jgi:hypothetical protein
MSRYEYAGSGARLAIGWDAPLASFFLTVWIDALQDGSEEDPPQVWLGASYAEVSHPGVLVTIAKRHVPNIPADLTRTLLVDQMKAPPRPLAAGRSTMERLLNTLTGQPPVNPTAH